MSHRSVYTGEAARFQELTGALRGASAPSFALAALADFLHSLSRDAFARAVESPPGAALDAATLNYLAGAVELAAERRRLEPPQWTRGVRASDVPLFGSTLSSVRLYLLTQAPVALRRRNLFVDASIDERV